MATSGYYIWFSNTNRRNRKSQWGFESKYCLIYNVFFPSVLWRCWLGSRKGIRPIKNWVVGCWHGYLSGARCRLAYCPADTTATHCLLLQWNPDWFLPFWYWLTRVVPEKGPLNGCVCVCVQTQAACFPGLSRTSSTLFYFRTTATIRKWPLTGNLQSATITLFLIQLCTISNKLTPNAPFEQITHVTHASRKLWQKWFSRQHLRCNTEHWKMPKKGWSFSRTFHNFQGLSRTQTTHTPV